MRLAIPVWDDKVSPVMDTASRLLVVEVEDQEGLKDIEDEVLSFEEVVE